jgi:SAM-dependent methyltransferase
MTSGKKQSLVFGEAAAVYDSVRPGYPEALVADVIRFGSVAPGDRALEVGAGTGKATALFAARGLRLLCLEPSSEMAGILRRRCRRFPDVEVEERSFEDWSPNGAAFRLLISAQSWHWVSPDVRYPKAHAALEVGGALALFWNRPVWKDSELREAIDEVYGRCAPRLRAREPGFPGLELPAMDEAWVGEIEGSGRFDSVTSREYGWSQDYSTERYRQLLETQSDHRMLEEGERCALLDAVDEVVEATGGQLTVDYVTKLYLARRA